jgi:hypothetical protein
LYVCQVIVIAIEGLGCVEIPDEYFLYYNSEYGKVPSWVGAT